MNKTKTLSMEINKRKIAKFTEVRN